MNGNNSLRVGRGEMEVYSCEFLMFYVSDTDYEVKGGCDMSKMNPVSPKATTKIAQQRVIVHKPTKKIKWNHKNYSAQKKAEKQDGEGKE